MCCLLSPIKSLLSLVIVLFVIRWCVGLVISNFNWWSCCLLTDGMQVFPSAVCFYWSSCFTMWVWCLDCVGNVQALGHLAVTRALEPTSSWRKFYKTVSELLEFSYFIVFDITGISNVADPPSTCGVFFFFLMSWKSFKVGIDIRNYNTLITNINSALQWPYTTRSENMCPAKQIVNSWQLL